MLVQCNKYCSTLFYIDGLAMKSGLKCALFTAMQFDLY